MIILSNITKSFNKSKVINDFSLTIKQGSRIAIFGHNGSGKSTLLKIILGLLEPDSGEIIKDKIHIGYASQNSRSFYMRLTANDNLLFFSSLYSNRSVDDIQISINNYAQSLHIKNLLNKNMFDLSAGEIKKIIFLRSLINNPDLILFDEALVNIDKDSKEIFKEFLNKNLNPKQAILWVTHDDEEAAYICDSGIDLGSKNNKFFSKSYGYS